MRDVGQNINQINILKKEIALELIPQSQGAQWIVNWASCKSSVRNSDNLYSAFTTHHWEEYSSLLREEAILLVYYQQE
jgi:hypothetical protein